MSSLTDFTSASITGDISRLQPADELEYLNIEAARDQALEDALNLTDEEKEEIDEQTRQDAENAATEAAAQRKHDALGEWLDYLYPVKDEKRIADSEIY